MPPSEMDDRYREDLEEELGRERTRLHWQERADFDHRVADREEWERSLSARRARVAAMQAELDGAK